MKIKAIITGCTGMVGEGVLHECLNHAAVESVLVINRKPCGVTHPKLKELIHADFQDISPIMGQLAGYNACYFCMGVSAVGMKEPEYTRLTYDLTLSFARILHAVCPELVFCYVSGSGTDSTEAGKSMWARVKGRTENALMKVGFKAAYMFRPGYMQPTPGLKNTLKYYGALSWMYPVLRGLFPKFVTTLAELGQAMIRVTTHGHEMSVIEVPDIVKLAKEAAGSGQAQ